MSTGVEAEIVTLRVLCTRECPPENSGSPRYGVEVFDLKGNRIFTAKDLSSDAKAVEQFVQCCNREKLHRIHLEDVIADFVQLLHM